MTVLILFISPLLLTSADLDEFCEQEIWDGEEVINRKRSSYLQKTSEWLKIDFNKKIYLPCNNYCDSENYAIFLVIKVESQLIVHS